MKATGQGRKRKVRIFSPARNVGYTIESLLKEFDDLYDALRKENITLEVLILEDASTDDTARILDAALSENRKFARWLSVRHNPTNVGNSENIVSGYVWATEDASVDYVGCIDADNEHSPSAIKRHLLKIVSGVCDGVVGSINFADSYIDQAAIEKAMLDLNEQMNAGNREAFKLALSLAMNFKNNLISVNDHLDRLMMRFHGRMQSTLAQIKGIFYIQSPGFNIHQRHRVARALELLSAYRGFLASEGAGEFPKWGLHLVVIYLISIGTGATIEAAYLECFGRSPNRTPEKLLSQAQAAAYHETWLLKFASKGFAA
jgi:glycosyltransferase involved in cell wall biosynthesis